MAFKAISADPLQTQQAPSSIKGVCEYLSNRFARLCLQSELLHQPAFPLMMP